MIGVSRFLNFFLDVLQVMLKTWKNNFISFVFLLELLGLRFLQNVTTQLVIN